MKKHYLLLAIILLSSCGKVLFQTPQPEKAERIIKIPQNLWGFYLSEDDTLIIGEQLGIRHIIRHDRNRGYGNNQKTCYMHALELDADIVVMLHPDYQYTPKLIPSMAWLISNGVFDVVLGSRILGDKAIINGMPLYKYISNRILTGLQNLIIWQKLS